MYLASDEVMIGVSHLARKSARMIRVNTRVVLDNRERVIAKITVEDDTILLTDEDGNVFRRTPGAKIEVR